MSVFFQLKPVSAFQDCSVMQDQRVVKWGPLRGLFQNRSPHPNSNANNVDTASHTCTQSLISPPQAVFTRNPKTPAETNKTNYKAFKGSLVGLELIAVNKIMHFDRNSK